jgi:hypothetical protein
MEEMITDSGTPPFTILTMSRLVSGAGACCPISSGHNTPPINKTMKNSDGRLA